ncbi:MAG: drug/metabolite transporter (DMT)-like permease [Paracoccaceae bacterium]
MKIATDLTTDRQPTRQTVFKAVAFVLLAILFFDAMSIAVRFLLVRYSAQELSVYRNVLGVIPSLVVMIWVGELKLRGTKLKIRQWKMAMARGLVVALAQVFYFAALGRLEYATIAALMFTNALFVVALSVPVLRERVGAWRWGAVLFGFLGVMLILRPGTDTFTLAALLPVAASFCYAIAGLMVRKIDRDVSTALLYLYSAVAAALGALVLALLTTDFTTVDTVKDAGMILFMGLAGGCGVLALTIGYRAVPPSIVAPFQYFGLLSATAIGFLFFGELPLETLFPGILLIIGSGLLILWREGRKRA